MRKTSGNERRAPISSESASSGSGQRFGAAYGASVAPDRNWRALLRNVFPFLAWFPLSSATLRGDLIAGITVALVLIPQSMAYAQLAGLPVVYGLYASFLPVIVAALWGSSAQLHTGPTAMLSLLTAAALAPLAALGSPQYIALAIMLAIMVGVLRLLLGAFKLGVLVNFLSHPVIVGFTNAAALIIGLSQLSKLFNITATKEASFAREIWGVIVQVGDAHLPTMLMGLLAFAVILLLKRYAPRAPAILIAVCVTTLISWASGFERNQHIGMAQIADPQVKALALSVAESKKTIAHLNEQVTAGAQALRLAQSQKGDARDSIALSAEVQLMKLDLERTTLRQRVQERALREYRLVANPSVADKAPQYSALQGKTSQDAAALEGPKWRIKKIDAEGILLTGGGEVIGQIPSGLPSFAAPTFNWNEMIALLPSALVMALIGFMEAISISRAIAARTKQRVDPNRELIGQGLGNIAGSFFQSFVVSGSFSRSALNAKAGAKTGFAAVFSALAVVVVLLFLTPLLYHLPQAVLAVIVMIVVFGLINFKALFQAWKVQKQDAIAGLATFFTTLALAPRLEMGILLGAALAVIMFMFRTMKPRVALLSRDADGTLRDAQIYDLPLSEHIIPLRVDRSLCFANVAFFEDAVLQAMRDFPKAKYVLVVGDGINELDASGEEVLRRLQGELAGNGVTMVFSGLKEQVTDVLHRTGLYAVVGAQHFFNSVEVAIQTLHDWIELSDVELGVCPLRPHLAAKKSDAKKTDAKKGESIDHAASGVQLSGPTS